MDTNLRHARIAPNVYIAYADKGFECPFQLFKSTEFIGFAGDDDIQLKLTRGAALF